MAIIRCPGCKRRVSNRAATCAGCGTAIAGANDGRARQASRRRDTQRLRIQLLVALTLFVIGALWLISVNLRGTGDAFRAGPAVGLAAIGLLWYLGVRVLLWLRQR